MSQFRAATLCNFVTTNDILNDSNFSQFYDYYSFIIKILISLLIFYLSLNISSYTTFNGIINATLFFLSASIISMTFAYGAITFSMICHTLSKFKTKITKLMQMNLLLLKALQFVNNAHLASLIILSNYVVAKMIFFL